MTAFSFILPNNLLFFVTNTKNKVRGWPKMIITACQYIALGPSPTFCLTAFRDFQNVLTALVAYIYFHFCIYLYYFIFIYLF